MINLFLVIDSLDIVLDRKIFAPIEGEPKAILEYLEVIVTVSGGGGGGANSTTPAAAPTNTYYSYLFGHVMSLNTPSSFYIIRIILDY